MHSEASEKEVCLISLMLTSQCSILTIILSAALKLRALLYIWKELVSWPSDYFLVCLKAQEQGSDTVTIHHFVCRVSYTYKTQNCLFLATKYYICHWHCIAVLGSASVSQDDLLVWSISRLMPDIQKKMLTS